MDDKTEIGPRHIGQYPHVTPEQQAKQRARERSRQVKFLKYVLMGLMTMEEAARALNVSLSTLDRHRGEFLKDDREDTDDLRALARARQHWRSDPS